MYAPPPIFFSIYIYHNFSLPLNHNTTSLAVSFYQDLFHRSAGLSMTELLGMKSHQINKKKAETKSFKSNARQGEVSKHADKTVTEHSEEEDILICKLRTHKKRSLCSSSKRKLKLSTNEAVKSKFPKSSSEDRLKASAELDEEVAPVTKVDKLLMLRENREACMLSMKDIHNNNEDIDSMQQQDPAHTEEDQTTKEKSVKLGSRQKGKAALVPNDDEMVAVIALLSLKDGVTPFPPSMDLSGKDKAIPNSSSHLKNQSDSNLKLKEKVDCWSEKELDALWAAVRRHGEYNWEAALADPDLKLLKNKTAQELDTMWNKEADKMISLLKRRESMPWENSYSTSGSSSKNAAADAEPELLLGGVFPLHMWK